MTDVTYNVLAGTDDGHARTNGLSWNYLQTGVSFGNLAGLLFRGFFRFSSVDIPAGSIIDSAVVRFISSKTETGATCNVNLYFEAEDDTTAPSSGADLISRSLGSAVVWNAVGSWTIGSSYDSPDISSILQDVVDRVGWNSGQAVTFHIVDNGSSFNADRFPASYENTTYTEAQLVVTYSAGGVVADSFGVSDDVDAFNLTDSLSDSFGVNDQVDAQKMAGDVSDSFGISDTIDAGFEFIRDISDSIGISDEVEGFLEITADFSDSLGLSDEIDAFHYSQWLSENRTRAKQRFFFTLTGDANFTTDVEIPVSSIYARKRSGDPTYLQVVVPSFNYSLQISSREAGTMLIDIAYVVDGEISLRERILEALIEDINLFEGATSRSIVLSGHKTVTYGEQLISIEREYLTYYGYQNKSRIFRFAVIDPYLNPGDTLVVGDESIIVGNIVYIINSASSSMEVSEAS